MSLDKVCSNLGLLPSTVLELSREPSKYYRKFERPKRTGGVRVICASQGRLKLIQRAFLDGMLTLFPMPPHVQGCVRGRSSVTNAQLHLNQDLVINIDLADFFGSVSLHMVTEILMQKFNFDEHAAETFARLSILEGLLPQGAPTSPVLANLAALKLDEDIMAICRERADCQFQYSRYVDDITISGSKELAELLPLIYDAIERNGFRPNIEKTKLLRRSIRQSVTGVVVNKEVSVPKPLIRKLRQELHYCEKWGIKEHCESIGQSPERFLKRARGTIGYLATVKPELAQEFSLTLNIAATDLVETREDRIMRELKKMIDDEQTASFYYERDTKYVVAPVSILLDPEEILLLRAFQLRPQQGWRLFKLEYIRNLKVADTSTVPES